MDASLLAYMNVRLRPSSAPVSERYAEVVTEQRWMREGWLIFSTLIALVSGTAQLWVPGRGKFILIAILAISAIFAGARYAQSRFQGKIAKAEKRAYAYESILLDIVTREVGTFSEKLEMTFFIGETASEDYVVERRWTTPASTLSYRMISPMVTPQGLPISRMQVSAWCESNPSTIIDLKGVDDPLFNRRVFALFYPALATTTCWNLRYRPEGIWNPLREDGYDFLAWSIFTNPPQLIEVNFITSARQGTLAVQEKYSRGRTIKDAREDRNECKLTWLVLNPKEPTRYEWQLSLTKELPRND